MTPESRGWPDAITATLTYPNNQVANLGHLAILDSLFDCIHVGGGLKAALRGNDYVRFKASHVTMAQYAGQCGRFILFLHRECCKQVVAARRFPRTHFSAGNPTVKALLLLSRRLSSRNGL